MRNSFVEHDSNGSAEWLSKIQPADNLIRMGDGTAMEVGAFSDSVPMMSYTPEELGINMDATPQAVAIAATNPYPYTDRQEVSIMDDSSDSLTVVKQDLLDGGVEFSADSSDSIIRGIADEIKGFLKENPLFTLAIGTVLGYGAFRYSQKE
jgi:hypothetical protein